MTTELVVTTAFGLVASGLLAVLVWIVSDIRDELRSVDKAVVALREELATLRERVKHIAARAV